MKTRVPSRASGHLYPIHQRLDESQAEPALGTWASRVAASFPCRRRRDRIAVRRGGCASTRTSPSASTGCSTAFAAASQHASTISSRSSSGTSASASQSRSSSRSSGRLSSERSSLKREPHGRRLPRQARGLNPRRKRIRPGDRQPGAIMPRVRMSIGSERGPQRSARTGYVVAIGARRCRRRDHGVLQDAGAETFSPLVGAVAIACWYGGIGPGVVAIVIGLPGGMVHRDRPGRLVDTTHRQRRAPMDRHARRLADRRSG